MTLSSDLPIERPDEDLFGLDPFSAAIARSIEKINAPGGVVLAINGPWGSGKSSAVNLVRHHLSGAVENDELVLVPFNPWWFAGTEPLTLAFFQELSQAIGPSLTEQAKDALETIGQQVSAAGPLLAAIASVVAPGTGGLASGAASLFGKLVGGGKTVEQQHKTIVKALVDQNKRFVVIIDDIDRLSPDDALTMFRLVKSVGRLPNVVYLLAFDRQLAERAISERFPSEGQSYLDKIVQSTFDVPPPPLDRLRTQLLQTAFGIFGQPSERLGVRFMNVFYDVVVPRIGTPRDVVRIINDLRSSWPAVEGEVDRADFLALTTLRTISPELHRAIRDNPDRLCGVQVEDRRSQRAPEVYDELFDLNELSAERREQIKRGLRRLFPRLDSIWGNIIHSDDELLQRERRVASPAHFRTYFAFSLSEDLLGAEEIGELIGRAGEEDYIRELLRNALAQRRADGSSRASLLLDELVLRAAEIDETYVAALTATIFAFADELDIEADQRRGFDVGDNRLRIHWLMNRLVTARFDIPAREKIYSLAMKTAAPYWGCDFARRCLQPFEPAEGNQKQGESIVSEECARQFVSLALKKLRAAARSGELQTHHRLAGLLFEWRRLAGDDGKQVRAWTRKKLSDPHFVVAMAAVIPTVGWSQGMGFDSMGDRVARRTVHVNLKPYGVILDIERFERRVAMLARSPDLSDADQAILSAYKDAPREEHY